MYNIHMQTIKIVKKNGNGAHVNLPKQWLDKKVLIIAEDETNPILRKQDIKKLIAQMIQDASKGY